MAQFTPQQEKAITTLDRNVSVSAGAGSGKTRVLVERFLQILENQYPLFLQEQQNPAQEQPRTTALNILAITFTRKAAREMRERVQKGMLTRLQQAGDPEKAYWQEQLQLIDRAPITTIDSFCSQVLRENPVEAGLDPNFQVKEEYEISAFREAAAQAFVEKEIRQGTEACAQLLELYPARQLAGKLEKLIDFLEDILELGDLAAPYARDEKTEKDCQLAAEGALNALLEAREQASKANRDKLEELYAHRDQLHELIATKNYGSLQTALKELKANDKLKDLVKELRAAVDNLLVLCLDEAGAEQARWWQALLTRFREFLASEADKQEIYSFGYLSARAVDLLERDPAVLRRYRERFQYLMVDEFQDTNEEQKRLVYLLSGGSSRELKKGSNLFVVGDAKQSIYRFRGADVSVFRQVRDDIHKSGGENIVMDDNFRSAPEIIGACNTLFDDLLGHDDKSDVTAQPLNAHQPSTEKPRFLVLKKGDCSLPQCRQAEGRVVAEAIRQLVADHRDLHYGDVAILLPAINLSRQYEEALTALGIKSQVSDGKGFYERPEVVDLINLLTVLLNTRKDWALAGFLRSPFVGLRDQTITDLLKENWPELNLWESLQQSVEPSLEALSRQLKKLKDMADTLSLPELLDAIQETFAVEPTLLQQKGGREKLANYKKLRAMAVNDAMTRGSTARDFLSRLDLMRQLAARESAANQEDDPEAVKIMTIHKSKGLEFPAVFLPDLSKPDPADTLGLQFLPKVGFGVRVPDGAGGWLATSVYSDIADERNRQNLAEKHRQLYVAMTRAEKYLYLVTVDKTKEGKSRTSTREKWGQSIQRVFAPDGPHKDQMDWEELDVAQALQQAADGAAETEEQVFTLPDQVYRQVEPVTVSRDLVLSASALLEYDNCPRSFFYHYICQMPGIEPETLGTGTGRISAIDLGTYIHKVLELRQKLDPAETLESLLDKALAVLDRTDAEKATFRREGKKLVEQYCASPLYQQIAGCEAQAEREFTLPLYRCGESTVIFKGSIDRLVDLGNGQLGIVDYKTGHPPTGGEERQGYTRQLTIYAKAAETLYPDKKVAWARLHFLQDCSQWELKDRDQEEKKLQQLLENLVQWKDEDQFPMVQTGCKFCPYSYFCKGYQPQK